MKRNPETNVIRCEVEWDDIEDSDDEVIELYYDFERKSIYA